MAAWPELDDAVAAARAGDLPRLQALVDWPLCGIAVMARAMPDVLEPDRATITAAGLAELDAAGSDLDVVTDVLRPVISTLVGARSVRPATPAERDSTLARLRVGPAQPGLTPAQVDRIAGLRGRAALMTEVYVVQNPDGDLPVARAADTGRLVLVLDDEE